MRPTSSGARAATARPRPRTSTPSPTPPTSSVALDRLEACAPKVESVSLVVAWFGDDLRAGHCRIRPGVEVSAKATTPENWSVDGVARAAAHLVSRDDQDRPAYGGTPSDSAVVQAIRELKARGYRVTFYPFILMDVRAGQRRCRTRTATTPPRPASRPIPGAGGSPARRPPGYAGSPDKSAGAGHAGRGLLRRGRSRPTSTSTTRASRWDGDPDDWGLRRMILHYAHLCAAAGGVDAFLIGSELRGITQVRCGASSYPAVAALVDLAADVRVDPRVRARSSATPPTGRSTSGTTRRTARATSSSTSTRSGPTTAIDFVGIDNYMPLADWRDGLDHLDAESADAITDLDYLRGNVEGGEGYDWFYASAADREAQVRTPITDGAHGQAVGVPLQGHPLAGGRTRTATVRAGSRAARRRRGSRRASRSASPRSAARRSTAARTSRTSSTTRSRPRASCRTSPAAGATTPCSGASSRRRSATGPSRRTTRSRASTAGG